MLSISYICKNNMLLVLSIATLILLSLLSNYIYENFYLKLLFYSNSVFFYLILFIIKKGIKTRFIFHCICI